MKKTFPRHKQGAARESLVSLIVFALIFFALVYFLGKSGSSRLINFKNSASGSWLKIRSVFVSFNDYFRERADLISELDTLRGNNIFLETENTDLKVKLNDLGRIASILGTSSPSKMVAMIVSLYPNGPFDTILIDKGIRDGITPGNIALAYGIYIGQVTEAGERSSKIKLSSYPGARTEGFIDRISLNVSVAGEGGGNLILTVPKNIDIALGDKLFLNSQKTMLIGQVDKIYENAAEPLKTIIFRIPLNLNNLRFLSIF